MYLDASPQHSPPHQVPYKLASRWMGPYRVLEVRGPVVHLELPPELGKISPWVNVRRLKFFDQRDCRVGMERCVMKFTVYGGTNLRDSCPLLNIWYSGRAMIRLR